MFQRMSGATRIGALSRDLGDAPGSARGDVSLLVREALAGDRVRLAFQPVVTSAVRLRIAHHEAFVRILDPLGREVPAGGFIAAVGASPLGREIDCAALRLAAEALRARPDLHLSVNMSARSIGNPEWSRLLEDAAIRSRGRLTLEIAEASVALHPERVARLIRDLHPKGIRFALDDLGSGGLALHRLAEFGFDQAKLPREVVARVDAERGLQAVVRALVTVAHQFGMAVTAVGVETRGEAGALRALGIDFLQGYLFGRPASNP